MTDLTKIAERQPCYLRLPEFCHVEQGNVVLAHIRRGGTGGTGFKPCDIASAPMCFYCHKVYDGMNQKLYTREKLDAEMLRAHCQWLEFLWKNELVILVAA